MNWIVCFFYSIKWGIPKSVVILLLGMLTTLTPTESSAFGFTSLTAQLDSVPQPSSVVIKSAILPGWGQAVNKQYLKIPLIYGSLATITLFSLQQHQFYQDYRAAYYNRTSSVKDLRFGATPATLQDLPPELLRNKRNAYRNRRDMSIVVFVAAWGLNVVDAYVFAHMRDFDVGPDLSATFEPQLRHTKETGMVYQLKMSIPLTK